MTALFVIQQHPGRHFVEIVRVCNIIATYYMPHIKIIIYSYDTCANEHTHTQHTHTETTVDR